MSGFKDKVNKNKAFKDFVCLRLSTSKVKTLVTTLVKMSDDVKHQSKNKTALQIDLSYM